MALQPTLSKFLLARPASRPHPCRTRPPVRHCTIAPQCGVSGWFWSASCRVRCGVAVSCSAPQRRQEKQVRIMVKSDGQARVLHRACKQPSTHPEQDEGRLQARRGWADSLAAGQEEPDRL